MSTTSQQKIGGTWRRNEWPASIW